jgi:Fe2+ or Zn2+ uptake regulation protein
VNHSASTSAAFAAPEQWLRHHQLRVTDRRKALISALCRASRPLTLQELHRQLKNASCDFATVFRFVTLLEKQKLVETHHWDDGLVRYEIIEDHHHHHHYLICRECQTVKEIDECTVSRLENHLQKTCGYTDLSHKLEFSGTCPSCQKKRPNRPKPR